MNSGSAEYFAYLKGRSSVALWYRRNIIYRQLCRWLSGSVLDVGCGIGDFLSFRQGTIGVDINELNVNFCRDLGLDARHMELNRLPFDNDSFDGVVLDNVIEHLDDPRDLLSEIHRVLRTNSRFVVGVPGIRGFDLDPDHKRFYNRSLLSEVVCESGFTLLNVLEIPFSCQLLGCITKHYYLYIVFARR